MAGLHRVIFNGATPASGEVWSVGLNYIAGDLERTFTDLQAWATGIATATAALTGNTIVNFLSSAGNINRIRVEQRDPVDETLMQAAEATLVTPKAGSGAANKVLQASVVVSLLTGQPGRSYRGRTYWPAWAFTPTTGLRFNTGDQAALLTSFNNINDMVVAQAVAVDPSWALALCVRSRLLHISTAVLTVQCGDVPDTQRRRRDALAEAYASQPI